VPAGQELRPYHFILDMTCPYCEAALPAWREIAETLGELSPSTAEAYAISLDPSGVTDDYLREHDLGVASVGFPDGRLSRLYRASRVPLTVVVDENGRVGYARVGTIDRPAVVDSVLEAAGASRSSSKAAAHPGPQPSP